MRSRPIRLLAQRIGLATQRQKDILTMIATSGDEYDAAIAVLNEAFPGKVTVASSYAVPIFNDGTGHWHIVDAAGTGTVVASIRFRMPADTRTPGAKRYLAAVLARAERLAEVINLGLQAHARRAQP